MTEPADAPAERFRHAAESATSLRELGILFTAAVRPAGIVSYAIGHLSGGGRPTAIFLNTWPRSWIELYASGAFIGDDPVVAEAQVTPEPFTWAELMRRRDLSTNATVRAARAHGFVDGLAVPIHGPGDARGLVALASGDWLRVSAETRAGLVARSRACFAVARRLFERQGRVVALSGRERDALALVAQGFEDAAIGAALGVTRASAHMYVERAKRRLGAATRAQAVALALAEGLL